MLSSKRKPPGRSTVKPENSNARRELGARLLKIATTRLQNTHRPDQFTPCYAYTPLRICGSRISCAVFASMLSSAVGRNIRRAKPMGSPVSRQ